MLVHQLIFQGNPHNFAFRGPQDITYGQLQTEVARFRDYLHQAGVRYGENVGLLARNSPAFVYAYMAIVSLGAVVVPINYQLTAAEVAFIVHDAGITDLVTMSEFDLAVPLGQLGYSGELAQHLIADIAVFTPAAGQSAPPVDERIAADQPCTIIYTSGTTGRPKGAVLTHQSLVSDAVYFSRALPQIGESDNILCILPFYHCFAWTCIILGGFFSKASVTVIDSIAPKEVIEAVRRYGVTVIYGVPSVYMLLMRNAAGGDLAGVRVLVSGGAPLPQRVAEEFAAKFGIGITEGYGLSEASPVVAVNPQERAKPLSIGLPIPGIEVKIADAEGNKLPSGEVGELNVRGPIVMKGYFNLPAETAHTLRDGWLHTGDLAYQDEEGYLFIVDRLKDMIITHGENIYPREIEEVLYGYPGVAEAAVIGVPDPTRGQAACAYVAMKDGQVLDKKAVKAYLRGKLAAYKIPREFIQLDALPKNQAGKIMKRLLQEQRQG